MNIDVKTVTFHVEQYVAAQLVDWPFANRPAVTVDMAVGYVGAMLVRMVQDVLVQRELLAEYPSTWWDAVKQRWFPKWALNRWPVVMNRIDGEILYPMIEIPKYRKEVTFKLAHYRADQDMPLKTYTKDLS